MDFLQLAKARHSVRAYQNRQIEQNTLHLILQAGRIAPTAANKQPQRFLVLSTSDSLGKLSKAANLHGAPLAIVVCCDTSKVWVRPQDGHPMADIDPTIATDHMMLAAWSQGVSSCWITWFDPAIVKKEFNFPAHLEPVNILVLGYAKEVKDVADRHATQRLPLDSMVWFEAIAE